MRAAALPPPLTPNCREKGTDARDVAQIDRARAEKRAERNQGSSGNKNEGPRHPGSVNQDAEALKRKIEEKKKLVEAGVIEPPKPKSADGKPRDKNMVNPHTGKRDPEYTQKMLQKMQQGAVR